MSTYLLVAYFVALLAGIYYSLVLMDSRRFRWLGTGLFLVLVVLLTGGLINVLKYGHSGHLL